MTILYKQCWQSYSISNGITENEIKAAHKMRCYKHLAAFKNYRCKLKYSYMQLSGFTSFSKT